MFNLLKKVAKSLGAVALLSASGASFAATVVGTEVTTQFADTQTDMLAVGALIIPLAALAMGIRWVKATFF